MYNMYQIRLNIFQKLHDYLNEMDYTFDGEMADNEKNKELRGKVLATLEIFNVLFRTITKDEDVESLLNGGNKISFYDRNTLKEKFSFSFDDFNE